MRKREEKGRKREVKGKEKWKKDEGKAKNYLSSRYLPIKLDQIFNFIKIFVLFSGGQFDHRHHPRPSYHNNLRSCQRDKPIQ